MASDVQQSHEERRRGGREGDSDKTKANIAHIQTSNLTRNPRYSYLSTPAEMQAPTFQQFSSPTNSTIDESPISPRRAYTDSLYGATPAATAPSEKAPIERTGSPYGLPPPQEVHPAYYAPVDPVPALSMQQSAPAAAEPLPIKKREDFTSSMQASRQPQLHGHGEGDPPKKLAREDRVTTTYNPDSLAGPNGALDNHMPGQVSHPNATIDPEWKHGLCTPDALCCMGLLCPCIVYGKTQYRLSRKAQKQDPTDLLGYESCNGSCGLFALACGFQCRYPSMTAVSHHD